MREIWLSNHSWQTVPEGVLWFDAPASWTLKGYTLPVGLLLSPFHLTVVEPATGREGIQLKEQPEAYSTYLLCVLLLSMQPYIEIPEPSYVTTSPRQELSTREAISMQVF
jgi:hypothetical protein